MHPMIIKNTKLCVPLLSFNMRIFFNAKGRTNTDATNAVKSLQYSGNEIGYLPGIEIGMLWKAFIKKLQICANTDDCTTTTAAAVLVALVSVSSNTKRNLFSVPVEIFKGTSTDARISALLPGAISINTKSFFS